MIVNHHYCNGDQSKGYKNINPELESFLEFMQGEEMLQYIEKTVYCGAGIFSLIFQLRNFSKIY